MATLEIPSNVKCITSGQVPTTTNLKDGEFAFGKVGGVAKLYGNVNGVIIDFTGDGGGSVSLPIVFSGASPGPGSGGTIIRGIYTSGYPASAMIHLESPTYKILISPVQIAMFGESAGHTYKLELASTGIGYTYDDTAYSILRQDNVKTLFGNQQSIYGSGNIDLYRHTVWFTVVSGSSTIVDCVLTVISSSNVAIDSLTDLFSVVKPMVSSGGTYPANGRVYNTSNNKYYTITRIYPTSDGAMIGNTQDEEKWFWWTMSGTWAFQDKVTTV